MRQPEPVSTAISRLSEELGPAAVLTDEASRTLYGQDVSGDRGPVLAVVRPPDMEALVRVVQFAAGQGMVLAPRGGGMSYSSGYVCQAGNVLSLDLGVMDRVLEVNTDDMYVTVQAGCTWKALHEALEPLGVRTPFWGTLSGIQASVGGSLSQNSIFWGSGRHGSAADSVLGFEIVLANGEILRTGAGAQKNSSPFFRHYGPDLTGLFTCDAGSLGVKATVTLKLLPVGAGRDYASFDFDRYEQWIEALSAVSRARLAEACFAFDPNMQAQRMQRESLMGDVKALGKVVARQGSIFKGLREGVKVALAGRSFMQEVSYSAHFMIEEMNGPAAEAARRHIVSLCRKFGGREIENSIPKITRANPFGPLNALIGPAGERWLPVHGLVPHSKALETFEKIERLFSDNAAVMARHHITHGYLLTYVDTNCFVIEPVFYWPDELNELHRHTVDDSILARVNDYPANPAGRAEVLRLRSEIMQLFNDAGGAHLQIGRCYPYQEGLREAPGQLVSALKNILDPDGRINPGALGL